MIHLKITDYRLMPWANGRGQTIELWREVSKQGVLLKRLSIATVTENGAFSLFPEIERNLTVISGNGFDLIDKNGDRLRADPLTPVAFPGDLEISAHGVEQSCEDFNVMTHRSQARPRVWIQQEPATISPVSGREVAVFAVSEAITTLAPLQAHDLLLGGGAIHFESGIAICVKF